MYNCIENVAILSIFILNQYTLCSIYCTNGLFFFPFSRWILSAIGCPRFTLPISRVSPLYRKLHSDMSSIYARLPLSCGNVSFTPFFPRAALISCTDFLFLYKSQHPVSTSLLFELVSHTVHGGRPCFIIDIVLIIPTYLF